MKKWFVFLMMVFMCFSLSAQSAAGDAEKATPEVEPAESESPAADTDEQEADKEDKVKVTPKLTVYQLLDYHTRDLEAAPTDIGWYETPVYSRTNFNGTLNISKGQFTFSPYLQERVEIFLGKEALNDGTSEVSLRARNRFYTGFITKFKLADAMNVAFNMEFRFANDLKESSSEVINTEFRFGPSVKLSGDYDFGLKWSVQQMFGFYFDKTVYGTDQPLKYMYYEGFSSLSYEFLQHVKSVKDQKAWIFADFAYGYTDKDVYGTSGSYSFASDFGLGFKYSTKGITPHAGMHLWSDYNSTDDLISKALGFRLGVEYKKGNYSFGVTYIAGERVDDADFSWESRVATKFKFSI